MAFLRKMLAQVRLDTDEVASGATVRIMRPGCLATGGAVGYALTDNPGAFYSGAYGYAIDTDGVLIPGSPFRLNVSGAVTWSASDSAFKLDWTVYSGASTYVASPGDRLVFDPAGLTGSFAKFYDNDTGAGSPITASFDLPLSGKIEGYVATADVDLFVTYNGQDTYITDVSTDPRDYVTPADFAAEDGGWQNFQNALDYLSYVALGGELRLEDKRYDVSQATPLMVNGDGVSISGQGESSVLWYDISVPNPMIQVADGVNDFMCRDFVMEQLSGPSTEDETEGLLQIGNPSGANGCLRVRIQGMKVKARYTSAIALYGVAGFTIISSTLSNDGGATGGHGILIANSTGADSKRGIISACQLYDNTTVSGNAAISVENGDRLVISDCQVRGWTYGANIGHGSNSNDIVIDSCQFRQQAQDGIRVNGSFAVERLAISGNSVQGVGQVGILLVTDTQAAVIDGNTVDGCGRTGISLDYVKYSSVTGNTVKDCNTDDNGGSTAAEILGRQCGIAVWNNVEYTSFTGNNITETTAAGMNYGFGLGDGVADCNFIGGKISDPGANMTEFWYVETDADTANNTFLVPGDDEGLYWGHPLDGAWLTKDGGINLHGGSLSFGNLTDTTLHHASQYVSTPAQVDITVGGTYVKAAGTFTADLTGSEMLTVVSNRIQYLGAVSRYFRVAFSGSVSCENPANADPFSVRIYKYDNSAGTGATIAASQVDRYVSSSETGAFACEAIVELDNSDYVEVWVTRNSATYWVQLDAGYFSAVEV